LLEPPGRIAAGQIWLEGERIDNLPGERMRKIRGRRIGAIFQDLEGGILVSGSGHDNHRYRNFQFPDARQQARTLGSRERGIEEDCIVAAGDRQARQSVVGLGSDVNADVRGNLGEFVLNEIRIPEMSRYV
jgi:alpha-D-ribose 1-methylphosphonate 5-triphosphate synthase subunit PhnI